MFQVLILQKVNTMDVLLGNKSLKGFTLETNQLLDGMINKSSKRKHSIINKTF